MNELRFKNVHISPNALRQQTYFRNNIRIGYRFHLPGKLIYRTFGKSTRNLSPILIKLLFFSVLHFQLLKDSIQLKLTQATYCILIKLI